MALAVVALLALLAVWAFGLNGGGSGNQGKADDNKPPVSTITPGPTEPGPTNPERPGGRDESTEGGGSQGGSGGGSDDGSGGGGSDGGSGWTPGGSDGGSGSTGSASGSSGSGSSGAAGSGGGGSAGGGSASGGGEGGSSSGGSNGGVAVPADSDLPGCGSGVTVTLRSLHKEYGAADQPKFELTAKNKRGTACKLDLGRKASVVTIKNDDDKKVWASDDCVRDEKPALYQLPASGTTVHTFTWYREPSVADCGTPSEDSVAPGDYEIEVDVKGLKKLDASFELK